jgi:hypothetical protein
LTIAGTIPPGGPKSQPSPFGADWSGSLAQGTPANHNDTITRAVSMESAARSGMRNGHQYGFTPEPETSASAFHPPPLKTDFSGSEYSQQSPSQSYSPMPTSLSEARVGNFGTRYSSGPQSSISSPRTVDGNSFQPYQPSPANSSSPPSLHGRDSQYSYDTQSTTSEFRPDSRYAPSPMSSTYFTSSTSRPTSFYSVSSTPSSMSVQTSDSRYREHPWETQSPVSAVQDFGRYVPTPMTSYYTPSSAYQSPVSEASPLQSPVSPMTDNTYSSFHSRTPSNLSVVQRPTSVASEFTHISYTPSPATSDSTLRKFVARYPESPHSPTPSQAPSDTTLQQFASRYPESPQSPVPDVSSLSLNNITPPVPPPKIPLSPKREPLRLPYQIQLPGREANSPPPLNIIRATATPNIVQPHPQRPAMPPPQFTQPYIATRYEPPQQVPTLSTAQFEHPYSVTPHSPPTGYSAPPQLPERPTSAPIGQHQDWTTHTPGPPVTSAPTQHIASDYTHAEVTSSHPEDHRSPLVTRVVANMLMMRVGRSTVQTMQSTAKLPFYLSPWGDNNPITLPNVRKRDVAMGGFMKFGVEPLAPSAVTLVEHIVKKAVHMVVEETAEYGVHKFHGRTPDRRLKRRVGIDSLTLRIKHKLIGEEAELIFLGQREAIDKRSCAKAWFNPYLYASGRTPDIARSKDFSIAQLARPGLAADASIAPTLLSTFGETNTPIISLCPWESTHPTFPRYRRMAIFLLAITPYRTANAWSQSRIPNEARLSFHLFTHIPALIVPVLVNTPVLAWSSWTVQQMLSSSSGSPSKEIREDLPSPPGKLNYDPDLAYGDTSFLAREGQGSKKGKGCGYDLENHGKEIMEFLERVVDEELMDVETRRQWRKVAGDGVGSIINGVLNNSVGVRATAVEVCDLERAGVVMFRY